MFAYRRFGIKLELATIRGILDALGNPQQSYRCIHVAGTNGKGSVASMLASILHVSGFRTGLYTSPHLVRFNERIRVDDQPVSDDRVVEAYHAVKRVQPEPREPTFFEFATAMALYEFGRRQVDWAVIETGMGGRLDATNVVHPEAAVITNVSLEHREYLGNTIFDIASEKAGILKEKVPAVTGIQQKSGREALQQIADAKSAPVYRYGRDFRTRIQSSGEFTYFGLDHTWRNLRTRLIGAHQIKNAALALATCEILARRSAAIGPESIAAGLLQTRWPGRLELVSEFPYVLLDGAHNLNAARVLSNHLSTQIRGKNIILVVGILDDKPYRAMLRALVPASQRVIVTRPKINRALPTEALAAVVATLNPQFSEIQDVAEAVHAAVESAGPGDAVCVAGSLYVVGEARETLGKMGLVSD